MIPKLNGIDHVHVYARDREAAAIWYQEILGFTVVETYRFWAEREYGPLTIQDASETIHIALFKSDEFIPDSVLAFGVSGNEFLKWKAYLENKDILKRCSDHSKMWSLYFNDLDGNGLEITTADYDTVAAQLNN